MNGLMSAPSETTSRELETSLRSLLPGGMVLVVAPSVAPPADWISRFPEEAAHVATAVESRRAEYCSGRDCARRCLAALGFAAAALPPDAEGLPVWPQGTVGAISHSRGLCLAVAASPDRCSAMGVDLERMDRISEAAAGRVIHPDERAFADSDRERATLLFSLKEAFFKCQYPRWRAQPAFADLAFAVDSASARARIDWINPELPAGLQAAARAMDFRFASAGAYVASLAWLG